MPDDPKTFRHKTVEAFWTHFAELPQGVQELASKNFELLKVDAHHPSLQFKKVGKLWSARVGLNHRALAIPILEGFLWIWIGRHDEYERILRG